MLNQFRARLGIPPAEAVPRIGNITDAAFEVIVEERVPVFSAGLGPPSSQWVERCHEHGIRVIAMGCTVDDCRTLAALGIDAVVAQGSEAGGHRSSWRTPRSAERAVVGTFALLPQVAEAVDVPVIAAGGITNGRQVAAAGVLGADGVMLGTRFIATRESAAAPFYKSAVLGGDSDDTVLTDAFSGLHARVLRNRYFEEYRAAGAPVLPPFVQYAATTDVREAALHAGNGDYYPMFAGQGVGLMHDLPSCGELIRSLVAESATILG
jgi:nitronate monooxygenase